MRVRAGRGRGDGRAAPTRRWFAPVGAAVGAALVLGAVGCTTGGEPAAGPAPGGPTTSALGTGTTSPADGPGATGTTDDSGRAVPPDGATRRAATARAAAVADGLEVHRVIADDEVAVVHAERPATDAAPAEAVAVITTFRPDGTIAGTSTVRQAVPAGSANGHTMFDGGGDPGAPGDPAANEAVVRRLYDEVFVGRDASVVDALVGPTYTQHNPAVPDGVAGLKALTANGLPVAVERLVGQGDLVAGIVTYAGIPAVDIFRLEGGRIVEHWDVLGTTPAR